MTPVGRFKHHQHGPQLCPVHPYAVPLPVTSGPVLHLPTRPRQLEAKGDADSRPGFVICKASSPSSSSDPWHRPLPGSPIPLQAEGVVSGSSSSGDASCSSGDGTANPSATASNTAQAQHLQTDQADSDSSSSSSTAQPASVEKPELRTCHKPSDVSNNATKPLPHPELDLDMPSSSSSLVPDALPVIGVDTDWREFRARMAATLKGSSASGTSGKWAHYIPKPEKGSLLLAHPLMFTGRQTYFYQAVILLLEHSEDGSYGIILNKPSMYKIKDLLTTRPLQEFDACRMYVGGDVGENEVHVIHRHGYLEGCLEVVKGVYLGGIEAARAAIISRSVPATDFRWHLRYAGWGPGQLVNECNRGVWFTAAASPELILSDDVEEGREYWHTVLRAMGGEHAQLSDIMKEAEQKAKESGDDR